MMSHDYFGAYWSPMDQPGKPERNCVSDCPACELQPCPACTCTFPELDREESRIAGDYLQYMAVSLAAGMVLGAAIVVGLVGYLPMVIGLVSLPFLATAGILWLFARQLLRFASGPFEERDLRIISIGTRNPPCVCVPGEQE